MKFKIPLLPALESSILPPVLVALAALIGGFVRFAGPLSSDFPLNDGGLFHVMIQALQASHYLLPTDFQYNGILIPFAYPPLGFYISGLISDLLNQSLLNLMRWVPPLISLLTIPAFYILARNLLPSRMTAVLGTFAFALLPRSFDWLIMGGGITRSFGYLFAILTLACAQKLITTLQPRYVFYTSILASLTILTHPEAAVHTAFAALLLLIFHCRNRAGFLHMLWSAGLILLLTAPWWALMLARHGFEPYLAAAQSPQNSDTGLVNLIMRLVLLFRFQFTDEAYLPLLSVIGLIGLFIAIGRKEWFLPVWLTTSLLLEPRSAPLYMILPLSMLAAQTITEIILPALQRTGAKLLPPIFLGLLLAHAMTSTLVVSNWIADEITLQPAERVAMEWVKQNTPADSVFLVLTGQMPLRDPVSEWFPVLADRVSAATVFGREWIAEPPFSSHLVSYDMLQACRYQNTDCIQKWSKDHNVSYSHILILSSSNGELRVPPLQIYLDDNNDFTLIYRTPEISIYGKE
jgi:Dolichyl-phosphate-mannose-protein mannosyltransferase